MLGVGCRLKFRGIEYRHFVSMGPEQEKIIVTPCTVIADTAYHAYARRHAVRPRVIIWKKANAGSKTVLTDTV